MKVVAGLHSALAEPIRTFVEYKRALNRKYRAESAALRLDRYLCEHDATRWNSKLRMCQGPEPDGRRRGRSVVPSGT